jgi:hypothetical protein
LERRLALIADEAERGGTMAKEENPFCEMERACGSKGSEGEDSLLEFDVRTKRHNWGGMWSEEFKK